jgi:hypothetical protein
MSGICRYSLTALLTLLLTYAVIAFRATAYTLYLQLSLLMNKHLLESAMFGFHRIPNNGSGARH